jgi:hypothetical protein
MNTMKITRESGHVTSVEFGKNDTITIDGNNAEIRQWHKFDRKDKLTYPPQYDKRYIILLEGVVYTDKWILHLGKYPTWSSDDEVTHWMECPKLPPEKSIIVEKTDGIPTKNGIDYLITIYDDYVE